MWKDVCLSQTPGSVPLNLQASSREVQTCAVVSEPRYLAGGEDQLAVDQQALVERTTDARDLYRILVCLALLGDDGP